MPQSQERPSSADEDYCLIVRGLPRCWCWQQFKDFVRAYAPQVKHAYTFTQSDHRGVGLITVKNPDTALNAYKKLANKDIGDGRRLTVTLQNARGETLRGPCLEDITSRMSPHSTHNKPVPSAIVSTVSSPMAPYSASPYHHQAAQTPARSQIPDSNRRTDQSWSPRQMHPASYQLPIRGGHHLGTRYSYTTTNPAIPQTRAPDVGTMVGYMNGAPAALSASSPCVGSTSTEPLYTPQATSYSPDRDGRYETPSDAVVVAPCPPAPPEPSTTQLSTTSGEANVNATRDPKTIYIQNVHPRVKWQDVRERLAKVGCSATYVEMVESQSKRRAIVGLRTAAESRKAIRELNGSKWHDKKLTVKLNEPAGPKEKEKKEKDRRARDPRPVICDGTPEIARRRK